MRDMRETLKEVEGRTDQLDSMKEQLKDFVLESLGFTLDKLMVMDDALEVMDDVTKLNIASIYFIDVSFLRWLRRSTGEECGGITVRIWKEYQKELKKQFYPNISGRWLRQSYTSLRNKSPLLSLVGGKTNSSLSSPRRWAMMGETMRKNETKIATVEMKIAFFDIDRDDEPNKASIRLNLIVSCAEAKKVKESGEKAEPDEIKSLKLGVNDTQFCKSEEGPQAERVNVSGLLDLVP
ncbi:hypothetical protein Gohar_007109 [Gossypium harknessii]|uniref:Uncharacterized protein n=1 Tax=Gossypium harknessii TaxID=34285 RepID=A0A7J9GFI2_9ROSI|nr:hypothetical protein [Gossypium harknessii]